MTRDTGEQLLAGIEYITALAEITGDIRDQVIAVLPPRAWRTVYDDSPCIEDDLWDEPAHGGRPTRWDTTVVEYFVEAIAILQSEQRALVHLARICDSLGNALQPWDAWYAGLMLKIAPYLANMAADLAAKHIPYVQGYYRLAEAELGLGVA